MRKILGLITIITLLLISGTKPVSATEHDTRSAQMRAVLTKYNSPMIGLENELITIAEKYDLDWTLMAAIAGTESSFGKRMPHDCINPYGWGIYGDNKLCFESFEHAAQTVASGLAKKYNTSSLESI